MSAIVAIFYLICILALPAFAIFVLVRGPRAHLNRLFGWLSLSLWLWIVSLFIFNLQIGPTVTLIDGRFNFAAAAPIMPLAYLFVMAIAGKPARFLLLIWIETGLLTLISMFGGLIDARELIVNGQHVTLYGPLFPLYALHLLIYALLTACVAFWPGKRTPLEVKRQLKFVGYGFLATAVIALITNVIVPFVSGDFSWINVGTISTVLFLAGTAGATTLAGLFETHVIIRAALIYAFIVALALELYTLILDYLSKLIPIADATERSLAATTFVLVVNAATSDPLKKWLTGLLSKHTH